MHNRHTVLCAVVRQKWYKLCDIRWLIDTAGNVNVLCVVDRWVTGVTQLHDVVYVVCFESSSILRFNAITHQQLTEIVVKDLSAPCDIVACQQTSQLYVADSPPWTGDPCIWRVSTDDTDIQRWLPKSPSDRFNPRSLSVTSSRLLVTSRDPRRQLIQFNSVGDELTRVQLPDDMTPQHAVESPTGSFIVSLINRQLKQFQVVEVNNVGEVLRLFSRSHLSLLDSTPHVAVDSQGHILVADLDNRRILLLDSRLTLRRVIIDNHQLNNDEPDCLCYNEQSGQLLVGLMYTGHVMVFDVLCR